MIDECITFKVFRPETDDNVDRAENRAFLAAGVAGVECVYAGPLGKAPGLLVEQRRALRMLVQRLCPDEALGTVEVYANHGLNVFLRQANIPSATGAWTVRFGGEG